MAILLFQVYLLLFQSYFINAVNTPSPPPTHHHFNRAHTHFQFYLSKSYSLAVSRSRCATHTQARVYTHIHASFIVKCLPSEMYTALEFSGWIFWCVVFVCTWRVTPPACSLSLSLSRLLSLSFSPSPSLPLSLSPSLSLSLSRFSDDAERKSGSSSRRC